ncbi:MAG: iron-containing alcohol dehydrogenase [Ruminiclostridium sp.]|nr:iron-containing alcohol dehydrogenase [Ruminiclostridium sp.]
MSREFIIPAKIYTGEGSLNAAEKELCNMGDRVLIVTDPHVIKLGCFERLTGMLSKNRTAYSIFSDVTGEPTDKIVSAGLARYEVEDCDCMIAVGGGSPIDTMKAIAALSVNGGKISDYMGKVIKGNMPPMAAIPTTAGTGSEATKFTVITDSETDIKMLLKGDCLIPKIAVIDPAFSMSAPKSVTASTGLDALTHAVESYTSRLAQPLTDAVAMSAVKRIMKYLPAAYSDGTNTEARTQMSIAALEAGIAINNASVTIVHGMSRPIGALFHVPHGLSNAMLLEKCIGFALDGAYERFAELGRAVVAAESSDSDKTASEKFLTKLGDICRICEVPTLEKYGIDKEAFLASADKMADDALASGSPANMVKAVTKEDILRIYSSLWD